MRELNLILTGLDRNYMQKLALYAHDRLKGSVRVRIYDREVPGQIRQELAGGGVLLAGYGEALRGFEQSEELRPNLIRFTDGPGNPADHTICCWQPADRIFSDILKIWQARHGGERTGPEKDQTEWYVVLSDGSLGQVLPCGIALAYYLGLEKPCLLLDLTGHLGWHSLFELGEGPDLSDMILELRRQTAEFLNDYVCEMAGISLVPPPQNPMICPEIRREDLDRFRSLLAGSGLYNRVVVLAGPMLPVLPEVCALARKTICLYLKDGAGECVRDEWRAFYDKTGAGPDGWLERALLPDQFSGVSGQGPHVAEEWIFGPPGGAMKDLIGQWER